MRLLVIFAHPSTESFGYALFERTVKTLTDQGHDVDVLDLYRMNFDPVLSTEEWNCYIADTAQNIANVKPHVDKLQAADGLVFIFPTFYYGVPAILKGWFERVWLSGVAFHVADGRNKRPSGKLKNIKSITVITTSGSPKWWIWAIKDPVKSLFKRALRPLFAPRCKYTWCQLYNMNHLDHAEGSRFLDLVEQKVRRI